PVEMYANDWIIEIGVRDFVLVPMLNGAPRAVINCAPSQFLELARSVHDMAEAVFGPEWYHESSDVQ
ncbi:MAG: hypothetical protein AAFN68_14420, partial [Pseudomonadota bacterium]